MSEQAEDVSFVFDGDGLPAHVVVGWGGKVTAVWYRPDASRGTRAGRLFASVRGAGGVWSDPLPVSQRISHQSSFEVAAGAGSVVSVVWTARVKGTQFVFESHRDGAGWSPRTKVGRGKDEQVVVDGRGGTTVMWVRHHATHLATRSPAGVWSDPRVFTTRRYSYGHTLAANRAGDQVGLWSDSNRQGYRTRASFRPHITHTWPHAATVPAKVAAGEGVEVGVDRKGRVLAIWPAPSENGDGHIWWTHRSLAGRWFQAQTIKGNTGHLDDEFARGGLSLNPHGRGLAWWAGDDGLFAARYRPGHGFGSPFRVSRVGGVGSPLLARDGTAVIAGYKYGRSGQEHVVYAWQTPGHSWSPVQKLDASQAVNSVGARGSRMVILFQEQGLRAKVIDLR